MTDVLAILEQRGGTLKRVSLEVLALARHIADATGGQVHGLVIGPPGVSAEGLGASGADKVLVAAHADLELYQADVYAGIAARQAKAGGYGVVGVVATAMGKDLAPRVAARLGAPFAGEVTAVRAEEALVATRPVYAGKAVQQVKIGRNPCVLTVRPNAYAPVAAAAAGTVEELAVDDLGSPRAMTVNVKQPERAALDVAEASVVVSGGRGLKEPEHFKLIEDLAEALGGAVGASRAVVDAGWRPHAEQVGQTGKTVSPNLYVAVGISGAIQHLAGMRTAKVIVAINKDPDAPIFKVADYGIVGDLFDVVPRLTAEVRALREG